MGVGPGRGMSCRGASVISQASSQHPAIHRHFTSPQVRGPHVVYGETAGVRQLMAGLWCSSSVKWAYGSSKAGVRMKGDAEDKEGWRLEHPTCRSGDGAAAPCK